MRWEIKCKTNWGYFVFKIALEKLIPFFKYPFLITRSKAQYCYLFWYLKLCYQNSHVFKQRMPKVTWYPSLEYCFQFRSTSLFGCYYFSTFTAKFTCIIGFELTVLNHLNYLASNTMNMEMNWIGWIHLRSGNMVFSKAFGKLVELKKKTLVWRRSSNRGNDNITIWFFSIGRIMWILWQFQFLVNEEQKDSRYKYIGYLYKIHWQRGHRYIRVQ